MSEADIRALLSRGWVSLPQLAKMIGVTYPTVIQMRRRGQVKCIKVGGMWRIYEDELVRFLIEGNHVNEANVENIMKPELHR